MWLKSFLVQNQAKKHGVPRLPLLQGSLPKSKGSWGNNFSRRICQRGSKIHSSSKTPFFWKIIDSEKVLQFFFSNFFRRREMKSCKWSETHFPKVSRRSEFCSRGKRPFEASNKFKKSSENWASTAKVKKISYFRVWFLKVLFLKPLTQVYLERNDTKV